MFHLRLLALVPSLTLLVLSTSWAQDLAPSILKQVKSATVYIESGPEDSGVRKYGSGFFISKDLVVTNASVVTVDGYLWHERQTMITVVIDGGTPSERKLEGVLAAINYTEEIAILRVNAREKLPEPLPILASEQVRETMKVFIAGYPLGQALSGRRENPVVTVSSGNVSSLKADTEEKVDLIQIDGTIVAGVGGGPIVDEKGRLVGMSVGKIGGTQIAFAIPSHVIEANLEGRIDHTVVEIGARGNDRFDFLLRLHVSDPRMKIKSAAIYCWTCPRGTARTLDPEHPEKAYGEKNDSPKSTFKLTSNPKISAWGLRQENVPVPPGHELWIQPAVAIAKTTKYGKPLNLTERLDNLLEERARSMAQAADEVLNQEADLAASGFSAANVPVDIDTTPVRPSDPKRPKRRSKNRNSKSPIEDRPSVEVPSTVAKVREVSLGDKPPTQVLLMPGGDRILANYAEESTVRIFQLPELGEPVEIKFPATPSSVFVDEDAIIVACTNANLALLLDAQSLKIRHVYRLEGFPHFGPHRICGRTPDGGVLSIWRDLRDSESNRLIRLYENGRMELAGIATCDWASYAFQNRYIIQSNSGAGSDWNCPLEFVPKTMEAIEFVDRDGIVNPKIDLPDFLPVFTTSDHQALVVPIFPRRTGNELSDTPLFESYLLESSLTSRPIVLPGCVIGEFSGEQDDDSYFVGWKASGFRRDLSSGSIQFDYEIWFSHRSDGQAFKKVSIPTNDLNWDSIEWTKFGFKHLVYMPQRNSLLFQTTQCPNNKFYWVELGESME